MNRRGLLYVGARVPVASGRIDPFLVALTGFADVHLLADETPAAAERKLLQDAGVALLRPAGGDAARAETEARNLFTQTPVPVVLFADPAATERHFDALRHLAGADKACVLAFDGVDALKRIPGTAAGLRRKHRWTIVLRRADAVWCRRREDTRVLAALGGTDVRPALMPGRAGRRDWLARQWDAATRDATSRSAYGTAADLASVVILTHNDGRDLRVCLDSVRRHTPGPHEVIVVDNATTDGSSDFLAKRPDVRLLRSDKNLFFAGGCNLGLKGARGNHLVLLNADTVVTPRWLERLVKIAKRDPTVGLVGPCTNRAAGAQRVAAPGYRSLKRLDAFADAWAKRHEGGRLEVPRLDGFCLLFRRDVMESVGLLDGRFGPGGYEDYDYCLRARQAGYRLVLAEEAYVHHQGGRGYAGTDYEALRRRNRELFVEKWTQRSLEFLDEVW